MHVDRKGFAVAKRFRDSFCKACMTVCSSRVHFQFCPFLACVELALSLSLSPSLLADTKVVGRARALVDTLLATAHGRIRRSAATSC